MRGLIYKDFCLFFKNIDKKILLFAAAAIALLLAKTGVYAGLLSTIMLSLSVSAQNLLNVNCDEKADWEKYQRTMPVSKCHVVMSRYISVICTLTVTVCGSIIFSVFSRLISGHFSPGLMGISILTAIIMPLLWTGLCLPLAYWFGFRSTQALGFIMIIPMVYIINFFEDGPGVNGLPITVSSGLLIAIVAALAVFVISFVLSVAGYSRQK